MLDNAVSLLGPVIAIYMLALSPDKGNDWTITKAENETYEYNTWLPGKYDIVQVNKNQIFNFTSGDCSVPFVNCTYFMDADNHTRIRLTGQMTPEISTLTFNSSENLMPITVYFFNNKTWLNLDHKVFQPQFSIPLAISASGDEFATFSCVYTSYLEINATVYFGLNNEMIYRDNMDEVKNHPQVVNIEVESMLVFRKYTLTVKRVNDIDYYTCELAGSYLTHAIIWI